MIGGALVRFQPDSVKQSGDGLWKDIRQRAPSIVRDVLTEIAKPGLQGLNLSDKSGKINWRGGLRGAKRGAKRAIKRKAEQELKRLVSKKVRKDIFGR